MSVMLFTLAMKKINASEYTGTIYLDRGPTIKDVTRVGVVKGQPGLAYAVVETEEDSGVEHEGFFYFQVKDLIGFLTHEDVGEKADEDEEDKD